MKALYLLPLLAATPVLADQTVPTMPVAIVTVCNGVVTNVRPVFGPLPTITDEKAAAIPASAQTKMPVPKVGTLPATPDCVIEPAYRQH